MSSSTKKIIQRQGIGGARVWNTLEQSGQGSPHWECGIWNPRQVWEEAVWASKRIVVRQREQEVQRPWGRNGSGLFKGSKKEAGAYRCTDKEREREAEESRDPLQHLVSRGQGPGGGCTSYVCMDRLLFWVTRSPKRVSSRGSIWFLLWQNHIKTWSLWTAPHTAVQRPSPPASSLDVNWRAAEVQLSKMINRIISWGGGGQALIMQARITLGLLILTHSPARGAPKIPEVTALINVVLLKLLAESSMILTWT